jgi:streptomycin 6-kinase
LARRWRVDPGEMFETESSLIVYGRRDGEPVVLKVVKAPGDEWWSGEVVSAFGGRGMVSALDHVGGAVLLGRLDPGRPLVELTRAGQDEAATAIVADVIASMSPGAAPEWCPRVRDWATGFAWYEASGDTQIPRPMVARAGAMYAALCETQGPTRLLHGDLQHYNILFDRERGWMAIDPKGVVGEVAYEVGAALRNPGECLEVFADPAVIERRVALFASWWGVDDGRLLRWAYAQAVLSAIWHVQDGRVVGEGSPSLALARTLEAMV